MKVICTKLLRADGKPVDKSDWIILGKIYHVLSVEIDFPDRISYRVTGKDGDYTSWNVFMVLVSCFEIVSDKIPSIWQPYISEKGGLLLGPSAWYKPGFLERYYDDDPEAERIFVRDAQMIVAEDP